MCLAVPGKIIEIYNTGPLRMGKIDFGGVTRDICLEYVPEAEIGHYTIVHVGFAISLLSEEEARASLETLQELVDIETELGMNEIDSEAVDVLSMHRQDVSGGNT
jgi:hydrogenase expression/formation protein HypC